MRKEGIDMKKKFEIGLYTLGDHMPNPKTGTLISEQQRIEDIIQAAKLADAYGMDLFAVGESHQEHFISQAHALILAAIARETKNIIVSSSASVLSTSDPVRVYEDFSTLDLISDGRAEIVAGRASRLGGFELLGFNVRDYEELFEEKMELLTMLNNEETINWRGRFRAPLENAHLLPKPKNGKLPIWRAVGGPPASAVKAGIAGVPMILATLAGPASLFNHSVETFRKHWKAYGHNPEEAKVGITALFHTQETDTDALRSFYPHLDQGFKMANGTGFSMELMADSIDVRQAMLVGSPQTIVDKILYQYDLYQHDRLMIQLDMGGIPFDEVSRQIKVLAEEIIPAVRAGIEAREAVKEQQ
ncbi:LLM class flavin-dependent oxidoreductase [Erysipelothrix sp. HDW6C]|nr:LLM class flavin-dependent oxidoreductase [Erysipelothrix sp. HDW6C]